MENKALKEENKNHKNEKLEAKKENEKLANEIQKLNEIYTAKCLVSDVMSASLQDLYLEQEEVRKTEKGKLQTEVKKM